MLSEDMETLRVSSRAWDDSNQAAEKAALLAAQDQKGKSA